MEFKICLMLKYACHLPCECDCLSNFQLTTFISSLLKKLIYEMKILELITWHPNMVQTM
jgi:hypothetical protein